MASKETVPPIRNAALARAELDGGGGADLVTGPELFDTPSATAIDAVGARIYWMNTGAFVPTGIWSANLDGTDKQLFMSESAPVGTKPPPAGVHLDIGNGIVIDQETRRIYWANIGIAGIYWVSLDNIAVGGQVSTGAASVSSPDALALDLENDRVYWTNPGGAASSHRISYAPLPPTVATPANSGNFNIMGAGVNSSATGAAPNGVAVDLESDPDRLYWTLGSGGAATDRLRYADLPATFGTSSSTDLTGVVFNISPNPGGGLRTPVIDRGANRIYWLSGSDKVSHANLDGTGGGTDLATGSAFANSPDGLSILKDPEPVSPPSISGTAHVGSTLTCNAGTWAADAPNAALYRMPASTTFEWKLDGNPIAGATSATHTPGTAGSYTCVHRASNFAGTNAQQSSAVAVNVAPDQGGGGDGGGGGGGGGGDTTPPDNDIDLGKTELKKKNGTAKIDVDVPGAGELELSGKGVKPDSEQVDGAGTETLDVKTTGKTKKKLKKKGKVKVTVEITFTPTGGEPNTESKTLTLKDK